MTVVPVIVQDWQQGCCGDPFTLGSEVDWWLIFEDASAGTMPDHVAVGLDVEVAHEPGAHHPILNAGGLTAQGKAEELPMGSARVRGLFWEDHHGYTDPGLPPTHGTVRRIRFACQAYERHDGQPDWDSPKGVSLTDTTHSDNRADANGELSRGDDTTFVTYVGWLVDLEVAG